MVGIRVDGNETIALGHVMRCIAIARQLIKLGEDCLFITSDSYPEDIIREQGFKVSVLHTVWNEKERELPRLTELIKHEGIGVLLIDSYEITYSYLKELKKHVKTAYLVGVHLDDYPVDLIINYARHVPADLYEKNTSCSGVLLGERYIPLRAEFQRDEIQINKDVKHLLLTSGGTDPNEILLRTALRMLDSPVWDGVCIHLIIGPFFREEEAVKISSMEAVHDNFTVYKNVRDLSGIMKRCDMALSAGGTTLAELCASGVPAVCYAVADNQLNGITWYESDGMMLSAGDVRKDTGAAIENILNLLERLKKDAGLRNQLARKAWNAIDGNGAGRIAEHLIKLETDDQ